MPVSPEPGQRIEFSDVHSLEDFYRQLAAQTRLPEHFDHNLDALFDVLTTELEGPLLLVWRKHDASAAKLGHDNYMALLATLHDAANERIDLTLDID